jgi:hypothetical protein
MDTKLREQLELISHLTTNFPNVVKAIRETVPKKNLKENNPQRAFRQSHLYVFSVKER